MLNKSDFDVALKQIASEKGLEPQIILDSIDAAIAAAYRRDFGHPDEVLRAKFDPESGNAKVSRVWTVVEPEKKEGEEIARLDNPHAELTLEQAREKKKDANIGDEILEALPEKSDFGRIAAQTAKQVILQRLKEAEGSMIYSEFKNKEGELMIGTVQQVDRRAVIIGLAKTSGIMPQSHQVPTEHYYSGQRLKVLIKEVSESPRGPHILVSRADPVFIRTLFAAEVPELGSGTVEIVGLAREAGFRTKMAVKSTQEGLDPVGSCVGQRGTRVQAVLQEVGEEKIDIILADDSPEQYLRNALSPARVDHIKLNRKQKRAFVDVPEDQLALAIGKSGQNVRLASELTGWIIDINKERKIEEGEKVAAAAAETSLKDQLQISDKILKALIGAHYTTLESVASASRDELKKLQGIGPKTAQRLIEKALALTSSETAEPPDQPTDQLDQQTTSQPPGPST